MVESFLFILILVAGIAIFGYIVFPLFTKEEYKSDDERLYDPEAGKFYEIDFSDDKLNIDIAKDQRRTENSSLPRDQYNMLIKHLLEQGFKHIHQPKNMAAVDQMIEKYDLVKLGEGLGGIDEYFIKDGNLTFFITDGREDIIASVLIFSSSTFTGFGSLYPKSLSDMKLNPISSLIDDSTKISPQFNGRYNFYYDHELDHIAISKIDHFGKLNDLHIEFEYGNLVILKTGNTNSELFDQLYNEAIKLQ